MTLPTGAYVIVKGEVRKFDYVVIEFKPAGVDIGNVEGEKIC